MIFFENSFPYHTPSSLTNLHHTNLVSFQTEQDEVLSEPFNPITNNTSSSISSPLHNSSTSSIPNVSSPPNNPSPSSASIYTTAEHLISSPSSPITSNHIPMSSINTPVIPVHRHSTRHVVPSTKLADFVNTYVPHHNDSSISSSESRSFAANTCHITEPKYYNQAKNDPNWITAMKKEIEALESNKTWELTYLNESKKAIGSKCVYKTKLKPDGSIERHKARLVAIGYQQVDGQDFTQTFSPVTKLAIVRVVIALATVRKWPLCQLDVNNAFLHGFLDEEVYMLPPAGYSKAINGQVCRSKKSLYGLEQASR